MSDKLIPSESVWADQIQVGDRITWRRAIVEVRAVVDQGGHLDIVYDEFETDCAIPVWKDEWITRILPDPVEVRVFWRVHYERFAIINGEEVWQRGITVARDTEEQARKSFEGRYPANRDHIRNPIIEHVRETIISREEVQP